MVCIYLLVKDGFWFLFTINLSHTKKFHIVDLEVKVA